MLIIPAIDIKEGQCVRLLQGDFNRTTVFGNNPAEMAVRWRNGGARRIHVVDLDGARTGAPQNRRAIGEIVRAVDVPVQLGGGIRDAETVQEYLDMGVSQVVLGTAALKNRDAVLEICARNPGSVILGIDARNGKTAVEGWMEETGTTPADIARSYENCGVYAIVYTDIGRDGMETGVNVEMTRKLAEAVSIPVIASGGVSGLHDLEALLPFEGSGIMGLIVGKALYSGAFDLEKALSIASAPPEDH